MTAQEVERLDAQGMDLEAAELRAALPAVPRETLFRPEDFVQPTMPLELLQIGPNVRTDPGELEDLAASIREFGVLQPVKVQSTAAGWIVLWGQRRVLASRLAGLTEIPVIIAPPAAADPASLTFEQLVENLQRADLNDIDEARALRAILDANPGMTHDTVADKLGKSRPWVSNSLRLLGLDDAVQVKVAAGEISGTHARAIASLPPKQQDAMATRIIRDKIPSRQIESELSWKAQEAANDEAKAKRTEKAIPKAIALLTSEKVPFDVEIQVSASSYNFDEPALEKAIKAAGWKKLTNQYRFERPKNGECDCTAIRLDFGGRSPSIDLVCTDNRHTDRALNTDHLQREAAQRIHQARAEQLVEVLKPVLADLPVGLARVLLYRLERATGRFMNWTEIQALAPARVAEQLSQQFTGYGMNGIEIGDVLEAFGKEPVDPTPATSVKAKKAAPVADPDEVVLECVGSNHVPGCEHV